VSIRDRENIFKTYFFQPTKSVLGSFLTKARKNSVHHAKLFLEAEHSVDPRKMVDNVKSKYRETL